MGRYAKNTDFTQRDATLTYLTRDDDTVETTPDTDVLDTAILNAEAELDGYIGNQYKLPLTINIPRLLTLLTIRIAFYNLWIDRKQAIPEDVVDNYNISLTKMRDISKGIISLGADAEDEETATPDISIAFNRA